MADLILVFQKNNGAACKRFGAHLKRFGWAKLSAGVYHNMNGQRVDQESLWQKAVDDFSFDRNIDFLAIFPAGKFFIPTSKYCMKKAPSWPEDDPFHSAGTKLPIDPDDPIDTSPE